MRLELPPKLTQNQIIFKYTKGTVLIIQFFIFKKETGMYPVSSL